MARTAGKHRRSAGVLHLHHRRPEGRGVFAPLPVVGGHGPARHRFVGRDPRRDVFVLHPHLPRAQLGRAARRVFGRHAAGAAGFGHVRPHLGQAHRGHSPARRPRGAHPMDPADGALPAQPARAHEPPGDLRRRLASPARPDQGVGGTLRCGRGARVGYDGDFHRGYRRQAAVRCFR